MLKIKDSIEFLLQLTIFYYNIMQSAPIFILAIVVYLSNIIALRKRKKESKIIFIYDSANWPSKVRTGFSTTAATLFTTVRRLRLIYRGSIEVE